MQQTKKYQLNKPEMGDTFSTAPLNENMDTLDGVLTVADVAAKAEADARGKADADLDSRVTALEAKKMVIGTYQGVYSKPVDISLGFRPIAVILHYVGGWKTYMITAALPITRSWHITDDGFSVDAYSDANRHDKNDTNQNYLYIAFG